MISVSSNELRKAQQWALENLASAKAAPFSFVYDNTSSAQLLPVWKFQTGGGALDDNRTKKTLTWTDPGTGLEVCCVSVIYSDFPVLEWTLYLKNTGTSDTPILKDIQALDTWFTRDEGSEFLLHHHKGDQYTHDGYEPYSTMLESYSHRCFAPSGGRGTDTGFPYFDLQTPGGGIFIVVGWPGQWAAHFDRDEKTGLHIRAGQELTHLKLHPGEEIRSPLMALMFWQGEDLLRAQNLWRRWMIAHNIPRPSGSLPKPTISGGTSLQYNEMQDANEQNQKDFIDLYLDNGVSIDYWWMDAGWYPFTNGWWDTGTWEADPKRFPNGIRPICDHAHCGGIKTLLWFEPERVTPGSWLYENHPEWLLGSKTDPVNKLLNLGNPEALKWLTDHVDEVLTKQGIDLYRQDFNFPPLAFWRENDAQDRQGINENHHTAGYLAYWDELRRRRPGMLLDSCASGGRRNDLETLRRSVPIHKTDYNYADLPAKQGFHYNLFKWMPFFGSGVMPCEEVDTYAFRTGMCLWTGIGYDMRREDHNLPLLHTLMAQHRAVAPLYYGDYYPLTSHGRDEREWMAWQFNRPEEGDGMVQVFRRPASPFESDSFPPPRPRTRRDLRVEGLRRSQ